MNFPIPSFIPVPGAETMQLISIVSLIVGICATVVGVLFLFLNHCRQLKVVIVETSNNKVK